jgi:hypothetical protein
MKYFMTEEQIMKYLSRKLPTGNYGLIPREAAKQVRTVLEEIKKTR